MIIETYNLTKTFGGKGGFSNVSLSVNEGEVFGFLGKNGAGKSTFIRTLLGLLRPSSGEGLLLGHPIGDMETRRKIGYLPELFQYHSWLTGRELLLSHGLLYKMPKSEVADRIDSVLETVGLSGHADKRIREYSKGMKQRIGLGCAIISDPELLFLDEPTSALDPVGRKHVRSIILDLKSKGKTIFLNTHLLSEVEILSDRIAILDKGNLKTTGKMSELLKSPLQIRVQQLNELTVEKLKKFDPEMQISGDTIRLMPGSADSIPEISEAIVGSGAKLFELKRVENALESLFINTVGEEDSR